MPRLSKIGAAALAAFGWTSGSAAVTASYLQVAGGGAGGSYSGGGGGAGGYLTGSVSLNPTLSYTVTVGAGGVGTLGGSPSGNGGNGSNTTFTGAGISIAASVGGGGGGANNTAGLNGGSGGGSGGSTAGTSRAGGTATAGQGNNGGANYTSSPYNGGGGGGAGAVGGGPSDPANGGIGLASSITGASTYYAGGGGAGTRAGGTGGTGGTGGGGNGTASTNAGLAGNGKPGTANTGGGGGGSDDGTTSYGGKGGSGIVIISYLGAQQFSGGVVTSSGGNTIHTFTTSGTLGPVTPLSANYLVVAGGGGGGNGGSNTSGGGGGAGGYLTGSGLTIDPYSTYIVTVGSGGAGGAAAAPQEGTAGTASSFLSITSTGGGYGSGDSETPAGAGGSGGGGGRLGAGGAGTSGQGNAGGTGTGATYYLSGGGGGAGAAGTSAAGSTSGNGGAGLSSSISGTSVAYAMGAGGSGSGFRGGSSGTSPAGAGTPSASSVGGAGTANLGAGGGGGFTGGGAGGSGVVIISYAGATQLMAGGVVTIAGGNVIHTFNSSGYLTPLTLLTRSLRFRSGASAYLNRTFSTPTNALKFSWSGWVKRGTLGSLQILFGNGNVNTGTTFSGIYFDSADRLYLYDAGSFFVRQTNAVYRDPAAWYHIMFSVDKTTSVNVNLYVNGVQVTSFADSRGTLLTAGNFNSAVATTIGRNAAASDYYFDGYMAEVNFIDGQALAPTAFGTFNSYGVWQPITYGGSYGTNGFRLPFTNNASTTTLGYDFSPQGNNWTTNNISVTSGSTYDSMTDVPTLTSATAANYSTWNPLWFIGASTFSSGNLIASCPANNGVYTTMYVSTGKWYAEVTPSSGVGGIGVNASTGYIPVSGGSFGYNSGDYSYLYSGNKMVNNGTQSAYGSAWTTNDVIGIAIDADAGTVTMYKNNVSQGAIVTGLTGKMWVIAACSLTGTYNMTLNNGAGSGFTYTPPSGYVALNTYNL